MVEKLSKFLDEIIKKEEKELYLSRNKNDKEEQVYETNELKNILNAKFEENKIRDGLYVGKKLRPIPLTNVYLCPRLVTYNRLGYNINIDKAKKFPYSYLMKKVESFVHEKLAELLGFVDLTKQMLTHKTYPIRCKVDGILYNALIEFKTVGDDEFVTIRQPKERDLLQGRIMYDICKYSYDQTQIDLIKIFYISRNLKDYKEFNLHVNDIYNRKVIQPYYDIALHMYECISNEQLSDKYKHEDCMFCLYSHHCKYYKFDNNSTQFEDNTSKVTQIDKPVESITVTDKKTSSTFKDVAKKKSNKEEDYSNESEEVRELFKSDEELETNNEQNNNDEIKWI